MNRLHQPEPTQPTDIAYSATGRTRRTPAARAPRTTPPGEVNERYPQHPATGSFAVDTEGEITRWDKFAAHRSGFLRHTHRMDPRRMDHSRSMRKESRYQVAAPRRRQRDTAVVGHIGDGTTAGSTTRTRKTRTDAPATHRRGHPPQGQRRPEPASPPRNGPPSRHRRPTRHRRTVATTTDTARATADRRSSDGRADVKPASTKPRPELDRAATGICDSPRVHTGDRGVLRVPTGGRP